MAVYFIPTPVSLPQCVNKAFTTQIFHWTTTTILMMMACRTKKQGDVDIVLVKECTTLTLTKFVMSEGLIIMFS